MRKFLNIITGFGWILIQGCSVQDPKQADFFGSWKAEDGAVLVFNTDGTFSSENLSGGRMFEREEYQGKKYNEMGTWKLKNQSGKWRIYLSFPKVGNSKGGVANQFNIAGENGVASNMPPWYLFKYVGDPDDGIVYEFHKS